MDLKEAQDVQPWREAWLTTPPVQLLSVELGFQTPRKDTSHQ